ncbi:hypothetical protein B0A48_13825 [Cryoendolithus antarcticus]|uniref:Uncharacterized protein n=1 Tax=Cryoendolithus antarcticus TaxID=1507870 RepID=A0A1V8SMT6_9PEZI|nr:hypothetical protein B0A48_13825 [Cryoendolithus antarcticus]
MTTKSNQQYSMEELDELDDRDDDALEEVVEAVDEPYTGGTIALEDVDVRMLLVIGTTNAVIDEVVADVRAMLLLLVREDVAVDPE